MYIGIIHVGLLFSAVSDVFFYQVLESINLVGVYGLIVVCMCICTYVKMLRVVLPDL